jgi:hypothetical protein
MARPVELNGHDRRRPPAHYWTAPSHQLWRTQGERQRSHSYEHAGQTFKTVGLAHTMSGALDLGSAGSIRVGLFSLPSQTVVHPGRGGDTRIGTQRWDRRFCG